MPEIPKATATIYNEDCISGIRKRLQPDSVHLTVTSIPFEEIFSYSGKLEDVGNNGSTIDIRAGRFALNMRFVVDSLFWVTHPGCNVCIHIQQLLAYKNQHGFSGRRDFRGAMVDVFSAAGFHWIGEFAIQKDPQAIANRMNLHSLQFKTGYARDACRLAPVFNDYVMIFRKPAADEKEADPSFPPVLPLKHKTNPGGWVTTDEWIRDAHGIWTDILEIDVLDGARAAKESTEEKHVCPLQLEVIRRLVRLYTNPISVQPNVTVLDPFMGIGSTAWVCLDAPSPITGNRAGAQRNVVGFELKDSYHANALKNVARAEKRAKQEAKDKEPLLAGIK